LKVKEESKKASLKFNIQKIKILAYSPITSWQIDGQKHKKHVHNESREVDEDRPMMQRHVEFQVSKLE